MNSQLQKYLPRVHARLPAFILLTRLNRPIGTLLLLWPTLGALWLAAGGRPDWQLIVIFALGTLLMRSAGCCINDFADSHIDGDVLRTENRAIVTGQVTRKEAMLCFLGLCLAAFGLLLFTNVLTVWMSLGAVVLTAIYPFMKRYTHLPQLVLGMAFSWGILMTFTAQTGELPPATAWLLYVANCLWTVAYDTQYAMVDREYDLKIGVKSTAILFGDADRMMIGALQAMFLFAMFLAGGQFQLSAIYYLALFVAAGLFVYQQWLIRNRDTDACFRAFLNNHWAGLAVFVGVILSI
ncbi:4-hydroxybenzoate octaprenyltransferase [Pseudohongiella sp.]|uniref:4-hydroxybenzoate octaprenyltransferase n=1 Tax=Pseudohongiella sp. TaxID=1979412 RepID=UPI0039C9478E